MTELMPLRLSTGSHQAGTGRGCAMNVVSWENGDREITDFPACADGILARIVQIVNDTHCPSTELGLLCAPCSVEVLALAHRTVGTGYLSRDERARLWVGVLVERWRPQVADLSGRWLARANDFLLTVERYLDGTVNAVELAMMHKLVGAGAPRQCQAIETALHVAASGLVRERTTRVVADMVWQPRDMSTAHRVIDAFERFAHRVANPVPDDVLRHAVTAMQQVRP